MYIITLEENQTQTSNYEKHEDSKKWMPHLIPTEHK